MPTIIRPEDRKLEPLLFVVFRPKKAAFQATS